MPKEALKRLVEANASSTQVAAYLILAAFTDETGEFSTAGLKSIRNRLRVGEVVAERCLAALVDLGLIDDRRSTLKPGSASRSQPRVQIELFEEEAVQRAWFCMSLVLPNKRNPGAILPITALKSMTEPCVYTLLWLHAHQDASLMSVVPPLYPDGWDPGAAFFYSYRADGPFFGANDRPLCDVGYASDRELLVIGAPAACQAASSIPSLISGGFLYESIVVLDRPVVRSPRDEQPRVDDESSYLYTLWTPRAGTDKLLEVEEGLALHTKDRWEREDKELVMEEGRFQGIYKVLSKPATRVGVVGLIRLRYRVHNSRNLYVSGAWSDMMNAHAEYRRWMDAVACQLG